MAGKKTSQAQKLRHGAYKSSATWKTNRIAKLESHLKTHPDDAIAIAALTATKNATAPRRAGYKTAHINRTSGRVVAQLKRLIKGATNASVFEQKKVQAEKAQEVKTAKTSRKPRHKKAA